jgi:hypothetical protein
VEGGYLQEGGMNRGGEEDGVVLIGFIYIKEIE